MSREEGPLKAGAEQGKKKNYGIILEHKEVSVFVVGLLVPADMRIFTKIK